MLLEAEMEHKRQGTGMCGEQVQLPQMKIENGLAIIPIGGAIGTNLDLQEKGAGAVDTQDIAEEIKIAEADKTVHTILFEMDTPGGMLSGTPELADRIAEIKKDKYAFSCGMIASAGYWLASATDAIFATKTAEIGSIGVYLPVIDQTKYFEMRGIKVELIKAGKLKGTGFPGVPLSESGREYLQERVDSIYKMFTDHVKTHRGDIAYETMQGQIFLGPKALDRGLVDVLVANRDACLSMIR